MVQRPSAPYRPLPFLERDLHVTRQADGSLVLRSRVPLGEAAPHIPALLEHSAGEHTQRTWIAQRRGPQRAWQALSYGDGKRLADAATQALLDLDQTGRSVMVLSGNSLEHGILQVAAMQARMPHVAITPAYSLLATDLGKLQAMANLIEPAVLFVQNGRQFERALTQLRLPAACTIVCVDEPVDGVPMQRWADWEAMQPTGQVAASIAAITPDTVAKYLFTSGSTGTPKAVTLTQRSLTTAVTMHSQMVRYPADAPRHVVLSWMPWSHVAAGLAIFCNTIADGSTLYLDEGKPVPGAFDETLRNLREVPVTHFTSVPVGYTMLADALEADETLAKQFFSHLQRLGYSGAKLPDSVADRLQALAVAHTGYRVPFISAYGSTETAASVTMLHWCSDAGGIGLPHPGVEVKLLPLDEDRYEIRARSAAVTIGYLRAPELTAQAFDEEGFFRLGDAVRFVDAQRPEEGLAFAGRVAEEFKLLSGVFVRVGALRVEAIEAAGGLLSDVVVAGSDQPFVGVLAWPSLAACRDRGGNADATIEDLAGSAWLREQLRAAFAAHNRAHPASSMQIRRVLLLQESPSLAAGEITDKGYVNQRAVLQLRADCVARLYAAPSDPGVIVID
jgi:feruloyl-CoA synthase